MKRSAVKVALVALLAVLAIVAAAGTLDDVQTPSGDGAESPNVVQETSTQTESTATEGTQTQERRQLGGGRSRCIEWLQSPPAVAGILVGWALFVAVVYRRYGTVEAVSAFMLVAILLLFTYPFLSTCQTQGNVEQRNGSAQQERVNGSQGEGGAGDGGDGESEATTPDIPLALLAVVAVVAAAAVGGVLVTREDDDDEDPFDSTAEETDENYEEVDVGGLAAAAGRAADRIEDADDVDNEIYRAWVEMTDYLDVEHPESSTPGEFAAAAVDAGIDRDDVVELTELFERVRYGRDDATPDREQRALDALRRIDDQYGGEDA